MPERPPVDAGGTTTQAGDIKQSGRRADRHRAKRACGRCNGSREIRTSSPRVAGHRGAAVIRDRTGAWRRRGRGPTSLPQDQEEVGRSILAGRQRLHGESGRDIVSPGGPWTVLPRIAAKSMYDNDSGVREAPDVSECSSPRWRTSPSFDKGRHPRKSCVPATRRAGLECGGRQGRPLARQACATGSTWVMREITAAPCPCWRICRPVKRRWVMTAPGHQCGR